MNETLEHEMIIAMAWYDGWYTEIRAKDAAEIQGLDFNEIKAKYGRIYARYEATSK